ncbi:phage antirepressor KilAC domain-containing protein [Salmonella enterica]
MTEINAPVFMPTVNNTVVTELTMSSREISELTGKEHKNVMADIRRMLAELGEDALKFQRIYLDGMNRQQTEFSLDREHTDCLISGYEIKYRMAIVKRWHDLEKNRAIQVPQTLPEALRLAADLAEQKQKLEHELAAAAPKVEFVDRYCTANGSMSFRQVAKLLKAKEPEFRLFLIEQGIMYRLGGAMTPRAQHIDAGRFEVKTGTSTVSNHAFSQARFTAKGVKWIGGLWTAYKAERGGYDRTTH